MSLFGAVFQLEQYVRQRLGQSREDSGQRLSQQSGGCYDSENCDIQENLPPEILLNIFTYLGAKDLCQCANVSSMFNAISSDELLWRYLLDRDVPMWGRIERDKDPDCLLAEGHLTSKQVYLRCCPMIQQNVQSVWNVAYDRMKQYFSKKLKRNPRFALLGSGIESRRTSKIVYSLVHNRLGRQFEPVNMINGVDGIGSGITYRMTVHDGSTYVFDLLTLYSSRREDRERHRNEHDRIHSSVLLQHQQQQQPAEGSSSSSSSSYQVIGTVARLELDGIIYCIDAEGSEEDAQTSSLELDAFVQSLQPSQPVLVLTLIGRPDTKRNVTLRQAAKALQLNRHPNPWCVQESDSRQLTSLAQSLVWMIGHT